MVVGLSGKRWPKRRQIEGRRARGRLVATMGRINACGMVLGHKWGAICAMLGG